MTHAVEFVSFNLRKGKTVEAFLEVSQRFQSEFLEKQPGYLSRSLLRDGEKWADSVLWERPEAVQQAYAAAAENAAAQAYISFMIGISGRIYTIHKTY